MASAVNPEAAAFHRERGRKSIGVDVFGTFFEFREEEPTRRGAFAYLALSTSTKTVRSPCIMRRIGRIVIHYILSPYINERLAQRFRNTQV